MGQRSFIAVDLQAREAVGILPEFLALDQIGFASVFLSSLLYLTSPALGLTPVSAACVAKGEKGLLLFGPPNSGKTTSSYWAKKNLGMDFHADQAVFLELNPARCAHGENSGRLLSVLRLRHTCRSFPR